MFAVIYPQAIVASFLYSVGYRAHGGAIVAVFVSGLSMHKTEAGTRQNASYKRHCFPDLFLYFPTCSLLQAKS